MITVSVDKRQVKAAGERITRAGLKAIRDVIAEETRGLEQDLEKITRMAVPGRLWRAWKSEMHPRRGIAANPAGTIYVNGHDRSKGAMAFHTQQGRNVARDGKWLAFPTRAAGPRGRKRDLTPGEWERAHNTRLRFIYRPGKPGLLVLEKGVYSGKRGLARLNTDRRRAKGRKDRTIVIFVLIPFQDFKPSFAIDPVVGRRSATLPGRIRDRIRVETAAV